MNQYQKMQDWFDRLEESSFSAIAEGLVPDLSPAEIIHILNYRLSLETKSKPELTVISNKGE
ncbi:hypothetical protein EB077_11205 [bacterium]|nr:hypothetical protein [bacterium]